MTAWRRIQRTQKELVFPETLVVIQTPSYIPVLILDGKHFRLRKKPYTLYVAFDELRQQPLSWILFPRYELRRGYDVILRYLKMNRCRIDAFVSDWHHGILASAHDHYPHVLHQRCAAHVLQDVYRRLGGRWLSVTPRGRKIWAVMRRIALGYKYLFLARMYLGWARKRYPEYERGFRILANALSDIYQFERKPEIAIPRTANRIENFMGHLEQRLKTFRGMKTPHTLIRIITSIITLKYKKPTKK